MTADKDDLLNQRINIESFFIGLAVEQFEFYKKTVTNSGNRKCLMTPDLDLGEEVFIFRMPKKLRNYKYSRYVIMCPFCRHKAVLKGSDYVCTNKDCGYVFMAKNQ